MDWWIPTFLFVLGTCLQGQLQMEVHQVMVGLPAAGVGWGPQWGHPLTLLTGSPDWSEYNWLSDMLISFPGCRVPEPITPITEGSNPDLPELQTVWFSAPHIISHPSNRCLNNTGPWSTLPTPSHSSEPHPGDSFLKHSVRPSSPLHLRALTLQGPCYRISANIPDRPPHGGGREEVLTKHLLGATHTCHLEPLISTSDPWPLPNFRLWEPLEDFDLWKGHLHHTTSPFTMKTPRSSSKINMNTY